MKARVALLKCALVACLGLWSGAHGQDAIRVSGPAKSRTEITPVAPTSADEVKVTALFRRGFSGCRAETYVRRGDRGKDSVENIYIGARGVGQCAQYFEDARLTVSIGKLPAGRYRVWTVESWGDRGKPLEITVQP